MADMGNSSDHALPPQVDKMGKHGRRVSAWKKHRSDKKNKRGMGYYASVFVRNENDGKILMNDAALAEWSVDAMELIRNLLVRASNGRIALPYEANWRPPMEKPAPSKQQLSQRETSFGQESDIENHGDEDLLAPEEQPVMFADPHRQLPAWAQWAPKESLDEDGMEQAGIDVHAEDSPLGEEEVAISNLPLMAAEVSGLLNSIEEIMPIQRHRRLRNLRPPSMFRRRWYLSGVGASVVSFTAYHLYQRGLWSKVIKAAVTKIGQFFKERVYEPTLAM
jgi:hypothetical protein